MQNKILMKMKTYIFIFVIERFVDSEIASWPQNFQPTRESKSFNKFEHMLA